MPSKSKQQQKFFGIVRSIQKGDQPASKFSKVAQDAAKDMKQKDVKKMASTKHKGLPKKVKQETHVRSLIRKMVREVINEDGHTDVPSVVRKLKLSIEDSQQLLLKLSTMNPEDSLPSWWTAKIVKASDYLNTARDFLLTSENKK